MLVGCCSTSVVNGCCRVVESAGEVVLVGCCSTSVVNGCCGNGCCGNGCCGNGVVAVVLHLWLMAVAESLNQREK